MRKRDRDAEYFETDGTRAKSPKKSVEYLYEKPEKNVRYISAFRSNSINRLVGNNILGITDRNIMFEQTAT